MTDGTRDASNNAFSSQEERAVVEAEQLKAFFRETNDQNIAGALVMSLLVYVVHAGAAVHTWLPTLLGLYAVTLYRFWTIRRYQQDPTARSAADWRRGQVISGGLSGFCWGFTNTMLVSQVGIEHQLLILTVVTVSAAANASEGYAFPGPSRAFILLALGPLTVWLFAMNGDPIHYILGVMLIVFIPMTLWQGEKRNRVFIEAQQLRFRNEALARALAQQRDVAEQASRAKGRFLAAASHDLRQPMQALAIFHELLERDIADTGVDSTNLANAQKAATAMNDLLNALLDISKLDADVVKPELRPFPIQQLIDDVARNFAPLAAQKGLQLRIRPCAANVVSDSRLLTRVLLNLLSNAIRYTPEGRILIGCRRRGGQLELKVMDTGIGIAPEHQEAVFGEFFQVGNKARDRQQGLGLGLAIVSRIARLLGHPLRLTSAPGRGACFSLLLPLAADQQPMAVGDASAPVADTPLAPAARTLLLVDDEADIRDGLAKLVTGWGFSVLTAASSEEALALLDGAPACIDGIVTDMDLPGQINGIDLIATVRQRLAPELPALLVTGDTSEAALQAARQAGLIMLHKPVRPARLRSALNAVLQ